MAITKEQLISLGFKPSKRGGGLSQFKKYDTLIYPIDNTDFLYIGYNQFNKEVNNKKIWKSFKTPEGNRFTYCVISLGDTGYNELKNYLDNAKASIQYKLNTYSVSGTVSLETEILPILETVDDIN